MTHSELCELTAKRFVNDKTIAFWEVTTQMLDEKPDVLVLNSRGEELLYEIKMSHSDFLADFKKESRKNNPKFGDRRYYVCEWGLIQPNELPKGWGLYWFKNNKFYCKSHSTIFHDIPSNVRYFNLCCLLINEISCKKKNVVITKRITEKEYNTDYIKELENE